MANEKLSYEIAALYSGQPAIKAAFDDFAKLNAAGAKVTNQLNRLANQARNTGEEIRNSRQGFAQAGMQANQFFTQIASGTSPLLAMQQQLGDVGYAMSFMGGTAGRIGSFLAGPWGAAIILATSLLSPFIGKLFESSDATEDLAEAQRRSKSATQDYASALKVLKAAVEEYEIMTAKSAATEKMIREERLKTAQQALAAADLQLYAAELIVSSELSKMRVIRESNQIAIDMGTQMGDGAAAVAAQYVATARVTKQQAAIDRATTAANERLARSTQLRAEAQKKLNELISSTNTSSGSKGSGRSRVSDDAQKDADSRKKIQESLEVMYLQSNNRIRESLEKIFLNTGSLVPDTLSGMEILTAEANSAINENLLKPAKELEEAYRSVGQAVDDAFKNMILAGGSWRDAMRGIIQSVIDQLWKLYVTQQIVGFITDILGSIGLPMPKVDGARAGGGPVSANQTYLVGEKGPELFTPGSSGAIIPNHKTMAASGGGGGVVVNVDARGSADPAAVRAQVQQGILEAAPAIIAAAENRTMQGFRRPRLGGAMQ